MYWANLFHFLDKRFENYFKFQSYLIDDICGCIPLEECKWTKEAFDISKNVPEESETFKKTVLAFKTHYCGKDCSYCPPLMHCCGPDQRSPDNDPLFDGTFSKEQVYFLYFTHRIHQPLSLSLDRQNTK